MSHYCNTFEALISTANMDVGNEKLVIRFGRKS
jgi:hypothetical protein